MRIAVLGMYHETNTFAVEQNDDPAQCRSRSGKSCSTRRTLETTSAALWKKRHGMRTWNWCPLPTSTLSRADAVG